MFVFELYIKSRQAKERAWRKRGEEWVKEKNSTSNYSYYSFDDYERKFPCPVIRWGKVAAVVLPILGITAVVALGILAIVTAPPKKVDPNNPNDCATVVKKDDKVAIVGGDFEGSKGTVISQDKECVVNLTLTESLWGMEKCKKVNRTYCKEARENGQILKVENSEDILKL